MIESARRASGLLIAAALVAAGPRAAPAGGPVLRAIWKNGVSVGATALRFSPDNKTLASNGRDGKVHLWDVAEGRLRATLDTRSFPPDPPSVPLPKPVGGFKVPPGFAVNALAFAPDGATLASGGFGGAITLWEPATGRHLRTLAGHPRSEGADRGVLTSLAFSPDGRTLASTGWDRTVRLWDMASREERFLMYSTRGTLSCLAFSSNSLRLAVADVVISVRIQPKLSPRRDQSIRVFDVSTCRVVAEIPTSQTAVNEASFSADGRWLASTGGDGMVKLWDAVSYKEIATLKGHRGAAGDLAFSADGSLLATAGGGQWDHAVRLWRIPSGELLATLEGAKKPTQAVAISPDGRTLAAAGIEGLIWIWDLRPILDAAPAPPPRGAPSPR